MFIGLTQGAIDDDASHVKTYINVDNISHIEPFSDATVQEPHGSDIYLVDGNVVTVIESYADILVMISGSNVGLKH